MIAVTGLMLYEMGVARRDGPPVVGVQYLDSVAVMPLENLTGDAEYDLLGMGITEEIITHLARIPPLKVISRHSVQAISRQALSFPQLGNALGVRHIIDGSVQRDADSLRITLQHIDAETNRQLWTEEFSAAADDLTGLQEDIAETATARLVGVIPGLPMPRSNGHADIGPGQEAYLSGTRWLGTRTAAGLNNAIGFFSQSIEMDPTFAPAYADLASAYALAIFYRYDVGLDGYELAARSLALSERALALDPNLAAAFAARGYLGALIGQPADAVAADFERAASLQPNAASIPSWRARSLAQQGLIAEALAEAARAVDLDPLAPGRHIALAELSLSLGRYDEAIAAAKLATALEPRLIRGRAIEARALLLGGRARHCAELPLGPHRVLRASCLAASGRDAEADTIIRTVLDDIRASNVRIPDYTEVITYEDLAVDYALRGDAENALFWAATAYAASPVGIEIRVLESALFDKVRDEPNFRDAIAAIRGDLYERVRRDSRKFLVR